MLFKNLEFALIRDDDDDKQNALLLKLNEIKLFQEDLSFVSIASNIKTQLIQR